MLCLYPKHYNCLMCDSSCDSSEVAVSKFACDTGGLPTKKATYLCYGKNFVIPTSPLTPGSFSEILNVAFISRTQHQGFQKNCSECWWWERGGEAAPFPPDLSLG